MVGYDNAPVVQSLSGLTLILSYTMSRSTSIYLDSESTFEHLQVWRVITSQLIFRNTMQAIVGLILLYSCREFERQMGSKKFAAFLVFSYFISIMLLLSLNGILFGVFGSHFTPSPGPFFVIFSLLAFYYFHIPRMGRRAQYSIFGIGE